MTENSENPWSDSQVILETNDTVSKPVKDEILMFDFSIDPITSPSLAVILVKVGGVIKLVRGSVTLVIKEEEIPLTEHSVLYYKNGVFKVLSIRRTIEVVN